ncbi:glycosyltransferase [Flavobacterium chuncheonense]|uniref:Glycosyltransferase n=1 Tax=Flavobacterium chuncheonense TaxID=2026653 RepID=A0ABW5YP72_9FLAO
MMGTRVVLIIPFYNEEERVFFQDFHEAFHTYKKLDFVLVDDGSNDATPRILKQLSEEFSNVNHIILDLNNGKAAAIREAVLRVDAKNYDYIGYLDADLATPIEEIARIYDFATQNQQFNFIMGSRIKLLGNTIQRSLKRHYFGRVFATIVSQVVLKIPVYDTQCGAKIIKMNLAIAIFKKPFITKWLFDVELLLRFKQLDPQFELKTIELPLQTWIEKGNSKIKFSDLLKVPFQLLKIYFHYVR